MSQIEYPWDTIKVKTDLIRDFRGKRERKLEERK